MWEKNQITVLLIPAARARVGGRKALPQNEQGVRQLLEQTFKPQLRPASVSSWGNCTRRQFGSRCTCGWALTQEREKKKAVGCYRFIKISRTLHLLQARWKTCPRFFQAASSRLQHRFPAPGAKERRRQLCPRCSARRGSLRSLSTRAAYFCAAVCFSLEQEGAVRGDLPQEQSGADRGRVLRRTAPALGAGLENLPGCSSGSQTRTC